jgi:hypothetical protein
MVTFNCCHGAYVELSLRALDIARSQRHSAEDCILAASTIACY